MDARARTILQGIIGELRSISRELRSSADELNTMRGLGTELCASRLEVLADKYDRAKDELNKL